MLTLFLLPIASCWAQLGVPLYLSEHTKVSLLTSSPGEELYARFGHSALRIRDTLSGQDLVFNYGLFDFNTPGFYLKFVRGKIPYQLGIQRFPDFLEHYQEENRWLRELDLHLDLETRNALVRFLSVNYLPENRQYAYDFFFDNCATRLRDLLEREAGITYPDTLAVRNLPFRQFLAEYTGEHSWINFGFHLILGLPADKRATFREEMFLPDFLEKHLANSEVRGIRLAQSGIRTLHKAPRLSPGNLFWDPRLLGWVLFTLSLALTVFFPGNGTDRFDRIYFLLIGLAGTLFVFMWIGTDHTVTYRNVNLLWANPAYLLLPHLRQKGWRLGLITILGVLVLVTLLGWQLLPQTFHPAVIPLLLTHLLRLAGQSGAFLYVYEKYNRHPSI